MLQSPYLSEMLQCPSLSDTQRTLYIALDDKGRLTCSPLPDAGECNEPRDPAHAPKSMGAVIPVCATCGKRASIGVFSGPRLTVAGMRFLSENAPFGGSHVASPDNGHTPEHRRNAGAMLL
jgi:hypothetical protein